jgi:NitT/TauT family transport system ATP-binding protein
MTANDVLLELTNVTLCYPTEKGIIQATDKVSFQVKHRDRYILLGPSGCGKSSLLKAVGGFLKPNAGTIRLRGQKITKPGPDRMMVFQEFDQLLPWKTVVENVMFPMLATGRCARSVARERAMEWLDKVQLTKFGDSYPHTLSGGMKQRVAIARGMMMEPDILLMDEPFAALDALSRERMQDELLQLCSDVKFAVLFVTHSISEAVKIGTRILLLSPHPGRVKGELSADTITSPQMAQDLIADINTTLFADQTEGAVAHG